MRAKWYRQFGWPALKGLLRQTTRIFLAAILKRGVRELTHQIRGGASVCGHFASNLKSRSTIT